MAVNNKRRACSWCGKRGETPLDKDEIDLYFNNAYAQTFTTISRFVLSHASRFQDAEDIVQNVYTRFYKRISEKGYEDIESAEAFLINIAKFECRSFLSGFIKHRERVKNMSDFSEEETAAMEAELSRDEPMFDEVISNKILAKQIFDDIMRNDETVGKIFYLYFVCDMKLDEIAEMMDMKLSTVKTKLYRTLERQKRKFGL